MALINKYTFTPESVSATFTKVNGGFNADTSTITPMGGFENAGWSGHEVFDNITLAVEAGLIDTDKFVKQLFATPGDFEHFLSELHGYNEGYIVYDRWWRALASLAAYEHTMEGAVTSEELADVIRGAAQETGQL